MSQGKQGASPVAINRIVDGTQSFWHDLFKSDVKKMIKCIFFREDGKGRGAMQAEDLKPVEHTHFFHSHDSNGRIQTKCVSVGGHHHKITTHDEEGNPLVDKAGRPYVKCSKPFRMVKFRKGKRLVTVEEEVKFEMEDGNVVEDGHTHVFKYEKSKELSPDKMEQLKRQNAKAMLGAFEGNPQAIGTEPAKLDAKDTATIS